MQQELGCPGPSLWCWHSLQIQRPATEPAWWPCDRCSADWRLHSGGEGRCCTPSTPFCSADCCRPAVLAAIVCACGDSRLACRGMHRMLLVTPQYTGRHKLLTMLSLLTPAAVLCWVPQLPEGARACLRWHPQGAHACRPHHDLAKLATRQTPFPGRISFLRSATFQRWLTSQCPHVCRVPMIVPQALAR